MATAHTSSPSICDYDYIRGLPARDMAWEYLKRHPDYRRDWNRAAPHRPEIIHFPDATIVLQARRCASQAGAWGLCSFRRSPAIHP